MISKKITDFATTISFNVKTDSVYGFLNGFLFSVFETGNKKSFYVFYINEHSIQAKDGTPISIMTISGILQDIFSKYGITDYSVKENGLEVSCSLSYKNFYNLMSETSKKLSEIPSLLNCVCSECHKHIDNSEKKFRKSIDEKNVILCEECAKKSMDDENQDNYSEDNSDISENSENDDISNENNVSLNNSDISMDNDISEYSEKKEREEKTVNNSKEDSEKNKASKSNKNNSVLKGIIGAFLLTFGASLCFILLYAFVIPLPNTESTLKAGYYVCCLSALISVASVFGYKIFSKEEISSKVLLISGGISLVLTFIAQYISSIILFSREAVFTFENLTSERFSKMLPSLLKIPFTDNYVSPTFKICVLMDAIFIITALLLISFFIKPKKIEYVAIEEL